MEDYNDEEKIDYSAMPSEVNNDCTVRTEEGQIIDLIFCEHFSPDGDLCLPVMVYRNDKNSGKCCQKCNSIVGHNIPIFLMDNGDYCFPCVECNNWVWWTENEPWMYWLE
tara:strand:+ start:101 stop:430 length:330 start_codon:yes stop_codon:yes gene_type:complete